MSQWSLNGFIKKWGVSKEHLVKIMNKKPEDRIGYESDVAKDLITLGKNKKLKEGFIKGLGGVRDDVLGDIGFDKYVTNEDFFKKNPQYRIYNNPKLLKYLKNQGYKASDISDLKKKDPSVFKELNRIEQTLEVSDNTPEQNEAIKAEAKDLLDKKPFDVVDPNEQVNANQPNAPSLSGDLIDTLPINDSLKNVLQQEKGNIGQGLQQALKSASELPGNERLKKLVDEGGPVLNQILNSAKNYKGYEPKKFGSPSDSKALNAYDALINYMQPEQKWYQKAASKISPVTQAVGGAVGKIGGTKLGKALGTKFAGKIAAGGLGGTALSIASNPALLGPLAGLAAAGGIGYGINKLSKPAGPFDKIGKFVTGNQPNWFQRNLGGVQPTGMQKFRGKLGGAISNPNLPQNIRNYIEMGQNIYDIPIVNKYIGKGLNKLGERLGIRLAPQGQQDYYLGQNIASPILDNLTRRHGAALAAQSQGFFGNQYGSNPDALRQELQDSLIPAMSEQDIRASNLEIKRRRQALRQTAGQRDSQLSAREADLRDLQQEQRFENQLREQGLKEQEMTQRGKLQAMQNQLNTKGIVGRQQVNLDRPLERLPQRANIGDQVANALEQNVSRPVLQNLGKRLGGF